MNTLRINASLDMLSAAMDFIKTSVDNISCPKDACSDILTACEEVIVNIISYAYPSGHQGLIEISVRSTPGVFVEITISDFGKPFDPLSIPDPDIGKPIEERQIGGLGIFLVKNMMDDLKYTRDRGINMLRLLKRLDLPKKQG